MGQSVWFWTVLLLVCIYTVYKLLYVLKYEIQNAYSYVKDLYIYLYIIVA